MEEFATFDGALVAFLILVPLALVVSAMVRSREATARRSVAVAESPAAVALDLESPYDEIQAKVDTLVRVQETALETEASASSVALLQVELNEAAQWISNLLADRDRRLAAEDRLQKRLEALSLEVDRLRTERDSVLQQSLDLSEELRVIKADVVQLNAMLERSEMEKRLLEDELGRVTPKVAELLRLLGDLTTERDHLRRELAVAQGTLSQHHRATRTAETVLERALTAAPISELNSIEDDLRRLRELEAESGDRVAILNGELGGVNERTIDLRDRLEVGRPMVRRLQDQLASTKAGASEISQALRNARQRIEKIDISTR